MPMTLACLSLAWAVEVAKVRGIIKEGDPVVATHGWKSGPGHTNTMRILQA
jgi:pyruvate kinase